VVGLCSSEDGTLFAATADGLLISRDAGSSWQDSEVLGAVAAVDAAGTRAVAALAQGDVALSENNGASWRTISAPSDGAVAIALADDGAVWLATLGASETAVWRFDEDWKRWLAERASGVVSLVPPLVAIGSRVLRPIRDAQEVHGRERRPMWHAIDLAQPITSLAPHERTVIAATGGGAFVSRDGGATFNGWSDGPLSANLLSIAVGPPYVYALALGGTVWRRPLR
jgi:predicted regulator of Ras-like GTPase activity (Roadblock/LC7/MglB family)